MLLQFSLTIDRFPIRNVAYRLPGLFEYRELQRSQFRGSQYSQLSEILFFASDPAATRRAMDALGLLGSLGSLQSLIPNLKFAGAFYGGSTAVPQWKFGFATLSSSHPSSSVSAALFTTTALVAVNFTLYVFDDRCSFDSNKISLRNGTSAWAALLFNY